MIGLIAQLFDGSIWNEAGAVLVSDLGTPITQAQASYDGEAIADIYTITFASVIAGTSAVATIATLSPANPYNGRSKSVVLDNATVETVLLPGVNLKFSSSGSFVNTWKAHINIGLYFGVMDAFPPSAGTPSAETRVQVTNTGASQGANCKARLLKQLKRYRKTGIIFASLRAFAPSATEKQTAGRVVPYVVAASNVTGSGGAKVMDLKIDGSAFNVENLTTTTVTSSVALNVNDFYRATSGPLQDMEFQLSQATVNADFENVLAFVSRFIQIAPDSSGSPGTFGTADVVLTQTGQAAGIILGTGVAYFHVRAVVPDGGLTTSDPHPGDVALQGDALSAAGWAN